MFHVIATFLNHKPPLSPELVRSVLLDSCHTTTHAESMVRQVIQAFFEEHGEDNHYLLNDITDGDQEIGILLLEQIKSRDEDKLLLQVTIQQT